jgi:hypothetical protein
LETARESIGRVASRANSGKRRRKRPHYSLAG